MVRKRKKASEPEITDKPVKKIKKVGIERSKKQEALGVPESENPPLSKSPGEPAEEVHDLSELVAVVGIGASAGGLEAFEQFFTNLASETGMAYVVVPHLDPTHKGMMPELLQRFTTMPVVQIEDGMQVRPDTVYIIPPNADLSIIQGKMILMEPVMTRGLRMPIDTFFRHLAEDQDGKAVGILLSGMGTDGTLGIRALKEKMGMVMVQDPGTAKFGGMPQSAVASGLVDFVAPAENLPHLLVNYVRFLSEVPSRPGIRPETFENALNRIFVLIRSRSGQDFSQYKRTTIQRRIERRMGLHQLTKYEEYIRYLQENPQEIDTLAQELLIGVTRFFRDPDAWQSFKDAATSLIREKSGGSMLRAWIVGCSTGEEAYSMAIVLQEVIESLNKGGDIRFQIFASDVDTNAIDIARQGRYLANIAADVSPERLERNFIRQDDHYQIRQELRETVVFAAQNIIVDPPFTHLDFLSCRNLLIYLEPDLQKKLIPLFNYSLNAGGILFLGTAENIAGFNDFFKTVDGKWKIFQRRELVPLQMTQLEVPAKFYPRMQMSEVPARMRDTPITALAKEWLLETYAPPAVIVTENGDILYFHGRTGKYLEPRSGQASLNIMAMAREGLRLHINTALRNAMQKKGEVTVDGVTVKNNGNLDRVNLHVRPVKRPQGREDLYMVVFEPFRETIPPPQSAPAPEELKEGEENPPRTTEMEREIMFLKEQLQHTVEDMQSSQEEMKSMNEEMQSTNEELQSTNEELTTSKEELQSLNEELLTVNAELQGKIEELTHANDDMRNIMKSTDIAMLFLDNNLRVRRYTEPTSRIINLIGSDIGRPITDLVINLKDQTLVEDVKESLDRLFLKEKQVETRDGKWYHMRIQPYRTSENRIEGVVVTFLDITPVKILELSLEGARAYAENIIAMIREPILVLDSDFRVLTANKAFYRAFNVNIRDTEGQLLYDLGNNQWDIPQLRQLLEEILPKNTQLDGFEVEHDFPEIGHRVMRLNARKITAGGGGGLILLALDDVTAQQDRMKIGQKAD